MDITQFLHSFLILSVKIHKAEYDRFFNLIGQNIAFIF